LETDWEAERDRFDAECSAINEAAFAAECEAEKAAREWMTVDQVADERKCDRKTIYARIHRGEIPFERIGTKLIRVRRGDVTRAFEGRPKGYRKPVASTVVPRARPVGRCRSVRTFTSIGREQLAARRAAGR